MLTSVHVKNTINPIRSIPGIIISKLVHLLRHKVSRQVFCVLQNRITVALEKQLSCWLGHKQFLPNELESYINGGAECG